MSPVSLSGPGQCRRSALSIVLALLFSCLTCHAHAADPAEPSFTRKGADTCLKCHDEDSKFPVVAIFRTPHASQADPHSPFAGLQCESCHGPGGEHAKRVHGDEPQAYILNPGQHGKASPVEKNVPCLGCHQKSHRIGWVGSVHETADLACSSCHLVHAEHDPVLDRTTQTAVCEGCHADVRSATLMASAHPLRFGQMGCSDCHAVHDSMQDALLTKPTVNQTCYQCHADKRGPMLWEHAPVTEDCTLCHDPHGSNHPAMLTERPPFLCQECHAQDGHPSIAANGSGLASGTPSPFLLMGSCSNCHTQVHGSNHPSGAKLLR